MLTLRFTGAEARAITYERFHPPHARTGQTLAKIQSLSLAVSGNQEGQICHVDE